MATVPLRAYISEIESIIEQRQTEEAIAHCRHILHNFPKHIDTYRMLGKAYLESQRYGNAADILQRVLSAVPDDFISHVGMSIIREDEKNLDAAIWHMERAFEAQPYNAAIQGELRRLYGLRDGMQPPKVHLTRGALARMYVKGDLYQQAIAELRSAIAEDPQRFDLQVLLAQMYAQSNQDAMAIETSGTIINKLPYCLEANRILAQLLKNAKRTEEAEVYKKRVQELNPYEAYVGPNAPSEDQVPDQAVRLEQLIWDGGPATATPDQPEWAASVGVDFDISDSLEESLPDWMDDSESESPALPASLDAKHATPDEEIPDFMKEAGWGPSTGAFDESQPINYDDEESEEDKAEATDAVAGDIPDWLQQMAPPGAIEDPDEIAAAPSDFPEIQPDSDEIAAGQDGLPDWLQEAGTDASEEDTAPDWLSPATAGAAGLAAAAALSGAEDKDLESSETPDWLTEIEAESPAEEVSLEPMDSIEAEMPDWLQEMAADEETPSAEADAPVAAEPTEAKDAEIPDWLQEMEPEADAFEPAAVETPPEAEEAEMPDWLQEMAADEEPPSTEAEAPVAAEPVISEATEIPDWLQEMEPEADAFEPVAAETAPEAEEAEMPDWLQEMAADEEAPSAEADAPGAAEPTEAKDAEIPDWLQEMEPEADALEPAAADTAPEAKEAEMPDWLQEITGEEPPSAEAETPVEAEPVEAAAAEIPDWLQEIEPEADALEPAAVETAPEAEEAEMPDWLQEMAEEEPPSAEAETPVEAEPAIAQEAEIPDWLQEIEPEAEALEPTPVETTPEAEEAEIPDWLQEMEPEAEIIEPTAETETKVEEVILEEEGPDILTRDKLSEEDGIPDWLVPTAAGVAGATAAALLSDSDDEPAETEETQLPELFDELDVTEQPAEPEKVEVPDWLQDAVDEDLVTDAKPDEAKKSEIPDWLSEAVEEDAVSLDDEEEKVGSDIPDWIEEVLDEEELETTTVAEIEPELDLDTEEPEQSIESTEEETPSAESEEIEAPGFPLETTEEKPAVAEEAGIEEQAEDTDLPDWLQEGAEEIDEESEAIDVAKAAGIAGAVAAGVAATITDDDQEDQPAPPLESPVDELSLEEDAIQPDFEDADAAMAWLESLAAKQGVDEEELLTSPEERTETPPDWIQEIVDDEVLEAAPEVEAEPVEEEAPEALPDADEEVPGTVSEVESELTDEEDIPEWLSDVVEEETTPEALSESELEPVGEDEIPDWLSDVDEAAAPEPVAEIEPLEEPDQEEIPEWLSEAVEEDAALVEDVDKPIVDDAKEESIPGWLQEAIDETPEPVEDSEEAEIPAWIQEVAEEEPPESLLDEEFEMETPPALVQEVSELESEPDVSQLEAEIESPVAEDEEEIQWVPVDEPEDSKQEFVDEITTDDLPDWIQEIAEEDEEEPEEPAAIEEKIEEDEEIPAWLNNIGEDIPTIAGDTEISTPSQVEELPDDIPDWLQEIEDEEPPIMEAVAFEQGDTEDVLTIEEQPVDDGESKEVAAALDFEDPDAAMAWLESLAAKQGVSEEELLTSPEERTTIAPEWIQEATEEAEAQALPTEETIPEPVESAIDEVQPSDEAPVADIPDWITEAEPVETPALDISEEADDPGIDLPDFLRDVPSMEIVPDAIDERDEPAQVAEIEAQVEAPPVDVDDEAPDFDDADAAMAWLEGLAAKQGVSEDELLTSPDERAEAPPDWVQEAVEEPVQVEDEPALEAIPEIEGSEIPDWILDAPEALKPEAEPKIVTETPSTEELVETSPEPIVEIEAPETETPAEDFDFDDADAAMAWLESLAAKQGVSEDELLTSPEERTDTPPDWVQETVVEDVSPPAIEEVPEVEATLTEEDIDGWMAKVPGDERGAEADTEMMETDVGGLDINDADAAMAWLESLAAKQGVPEEELLSSPEERAETPPDWVQDAAQQEITETEAPLEAAIPEAGITPEETTQPETEEDSSMAPPSWITDGDVPEEENDFSWIQTAVAEEAEQLLDLNQASLIQLERLPGIGFRRAQSITAFRSQYGDFLHLDELLNVPGMDNDTYELLKTRVFVTGPDQPAEPETTPDPVLFAPQDAEPDDAVHEKQITAQSKLNEGNIHEAMADYDTLIKKGQRLEAIIEDLNLAAEKYPEEITIVQTLGDAYMQANKFQEALDAYNKAEGLLK